MDVEGDECVCMHLLQIIGKEVENEVIRVTTQQKARLHNERLFPLVEEAQIKNKEEHIKRARPLTPAPAGT